MEKRLIVAIVLSVVVMLAFQKIMPTTPQVQLQQQPAANQKIQPIDTKNVTQETKISVSQEKLFQEQTEKLIITFSTINGGIKSIKLKEYDYVIFDEENPANYLFNTLDLQPYAVSEQHPFSVKHENGKIIFSYTSPTGTYLLKKIYTISSSADGHDIGLSIVTDNISSVTAAYKYEILTNPAIKQVSEVKGRRFIEANALINGSIIKKSKIKAEKEVIKGIVGWTALKNRYFILAVKPPKIADQLVIKKVNQKDLAASVILETQIVAPGQVVQNDFILIVAPLKKELLAQYDIGLEGAVTYGFFGGISAILISLLGFIYKIVHNWGLAIICVTIIINLLLLPLTKKSMSSMHKMQELQPHMENLRKLHKDNPKKLNKEMMEMYKEYNVNPFGGCLPMLLQFPVFIAFYQALMRSTELKNASFLWIKDLSAPDALFMFPNKLPILGTSFNLLPIITLILMVVQQKVATGGQKNISPEMAQQQKMMALIFPLFFGFILWNFPSGLVLYWMTNSILMTTEQYFLKKNLNK